MADNSDAPSGAISYDNVRRAARATITPAPLPREYAPVRGGVIRRDIPPADYGVPADNAKRNAPPVTPVTVTSTTWITTDDCQPTATPEEDCDEEYDGQGGGDQSGDYSLQYGSSTSGMLAMPASSSQGGLYNDTPNPSENHVGKCTFESCSNMS